MKLKILLLIFIVILAGCSQPKTQGIPSEKITNFKPGSSGNLFLFYPSDNRVSQLKTYVKEVDNAGEVINVFSIEDADFRRAEPFQNPLYPNTIYLSLFGEAKIENFFYEFDLNTKTFAKKKIDYFKEPLGVSNVFHYGKQLNFSTILSHETGEQNEKDGLFNVSISNIDSEKTVETPYGASPAYTPLLGFNNNVFYGANLTLNKKDEFTGKGIVSTNLETGEFKFLNPENDTTASYLPFYTNDDFMFFLSDSGVFYKYDKDMRVTHHKFLTSEQLDKGYSIDIENKPLFINKHEALYTVSHSKTALLLLIDIDTLSFKEIPIKGSYESIRLMSYDNTKDEIYILGEKGDSADLLTLDDITLHIENKFKVDYPHLLDFVIKY